MFSTICEQATIQKKARSDAVRLDEFKRLRTAVETPLANLRDKRATLRSLEVSASSTKKLQQEVAGCNKEIAEEFSKLQLSLSDLDTSTIISEDGWAVCIDNCLDGFSNAINAAYNPNSNDSEIKAAIAKAVSEIDKLVAVIQKKMDAELSKYVDDD